MQVHIYSETSLLCNHFVVLFQKETTWSGQSKILKPFGSIFLERNGMIMTLVFFSFF